MVSIQLILSINDHYHHLEVIEEVKKTNPGLYEVVEFSINYDTLFIFVLIIGLYEMTTKLSLFKTVIRVFLICIILGTQFSRLVPIEDFYYGVYNTAWFSSVLAFALILTRIGKNNINTNKLKKASR